MYQIFNVVTNVNGEQRREKVMVTAESFDSMWRVFHRMGLEYALHSGRVDRCSNIGLTFNEFFNYLSPEMLNYYNIQIIWLDREPIISGEAALITIYELESHLETMTRDNKRIKRTREFAER